MAAGRARASRAGVAGPARSDSPSARSSRSSRGGTTGTGPQPAWVIGPRHGVPWATITQVVPRPCTRCRRCRREAQRVPVEQGRQGRGADRGRSGSPGARGRPGRGRRSASRCPASDSTRGGRRRSSGTRRRREVPQRLDAAGGRARPDRDEQRDCARISLDALGVVLGGDRPLDERHVVGSRDHRRGRLREVRDPTRSGDGQQLVLAVEQAELAAVARRELPDRERRRLATVDALGPDDRRGAELVLHDSSFNAPGPPANSATTG
jgi:hypothetical protein